MLERRYPEAERVVLVMDNLNTHGIESLYATYEPRHARQLAQRLEIHYIAEARQLAQHCMKSNRAGCLRFLERRIRSPGCCVLMRKWLERRCVIGTNGKPEIDWEFRDASGCQRIKPLMSRVSTTLRAGPVSSSEWRRRRSDPGARYADDFVAADSRDGRTRSTVSPRAVRGQPCAECRAGTAPGKGAYWWRLSSIDLIGSADRL